MFGLITFSSIDLFVSCQEDGVDLVTIIKRAYYYRRGKSLDYISDYILPTPFEFKEYEESQR